MPLTASDLAQLRARLAELDQQIKKIDLELWGLCPMKNRAAQLQAQRLPLARERDRLRREVESA